MQELVRFLSLAKRELGAEEVRVEVSTNQHEHDAPVETEAVLSLPSGFRLLARFSGAPPSDTAMKFRQLADTFALTLDAVTVPRIKRKPRRALDDALAMLCGQTHALAGFVFDVDSPVLWGSSLEPRGKETFDDIRWILSTIEQTGDAIVSWFVGDDIEVPNEFLHRGEHYRRLGYDRETWERRLSAYKSLLRAKDELSDPARTRGALHEADSAYLARSFGRIYRVVLVFDSENFSELHAEAAVIHALPWIERLTQALPPIDDPGGGRVLKMRHLRPV